MRVTSNAFSASLNTQLQSLEARQVRLQNEAASGQRITDPSDDPAATGRVLNAEAEKSRLQQLNDNAGRALDINQSSYSALQSVKDLSDRAGEIASLSSGTSSPDSLKAYATEVNQLMEQALSAGNSKLDTGYLFGGTKTDTAPFTATRDASGQITAAAYQGAAAGAQLSVDAGTQVSPYTTGADNQGMAQFINTLAKLRDALNSGDTSAVQAVRPALSSADDHILNTLGTLGAVQTRLDAATTNNSARFSSLETQISADADADLPTTLIQFNKAQTAYQTALQTGAKIMGQSLLDYVK